MSVFESDQITPAMIRQFSLQLREIPSLGEIDSAISDFQKLEGQRPTFHQSKWLKGIGRSASATDKILRRHYKTTLAKRVRKVLGDSNHELVERSRVAVKNHWEEYGKRLKNKSDFIVPGFGLSCTALNGRLLNQHGISLAQIGDEVLGERVADLTLEGLKKLITKYLQEGKKFPTKKGQIPELKTTGRNLSERVKRKFGKRLPDIIEAIKSELSSSKPKQ
jgi:hypothetical protein